MSNRNNNDPDNRSNNNGFRLALPQTDNSSKTGGSQSTGSTSSSSTSKGALPGVFSVSPTQKVHFAKGNLQYQASTNTWRFAENQWDYIGDANKNISSSYSGWIDLFGWGTGNNPTKSSKNNSDYSNFSDWGSKMGNGWRTLTKEEWVYVFNLRSTSSGIRYAKATVNGVIGVILLPDNWSSSTYLLSDANVSDAMFSSNTISSSTWSSTFAPAGAAFLPAAGLRIGFSVRLGGTHGYYWSASPLGSSCTYYVFFSYDRLDAADISGFDPGRSVRLACPAEN